MCKNVMCNLLSL